MVMEVVTRPTDDEYSQVSLVLSFSTKSEVQLSENESK